jgi:hypothetical protein
VGLQPMRRRARSYGNAASNLRKLGVADAEERAGHGGLYRQVQSCRQPPWVNRKLNVHILEHFTTRLTMSATASGVGDVRGRTRSARNRRGTS